MRRGRALAPSDEDHLTPTAVPPAAEGSSARPGPDPGPPGGGLAVLAPPVATEPHPPVVTRTQAVTAAGPLQIAEHLRPLLAILRWSTLVVGLLLLSTTGDVESADLGAAALLAAYTAFRIVRPLDLRTTERAAELQVFAELSLCVVALAMSGAWKSPFVLTPIPAVMLAGYGWGYRQGIAAAAFAAGGLTLTEVITGASSRTVADGAQAALMLGLCGCIGAFTRNLFLNEEAERRRDRDQYARMVTANDLLSALHEVVQTLPESLDLGEVVSSTQRRLREQFDYTSASLVVRDATTGYWRVELAEGVRLADSMSDDELPPAVLVALGGRDALVHEDLLYDHLASFAPLARSLLAAPLVARNTVVGVVAIEHSEPARYGAADAEVLGEMAGPLALAVDNATWFARLRTLGAEAERARIARDLHDRLAQSLAYVAFELERLSRVHGDDGEHGELDALHDVVRGVVGELRETLYQLRADVTDSMELEKVARTYLQRFQDRTGIACTLTARVRGRRLPIQVEQEVWRILQEALTNVERHADARRVWVTWTVSAERAWLEVRDDGRGFRVAAVPAERYGLVGMRERAAAVGAHLTLDSEPGFGTRILVELEVPR